MNSINPDNEQHQTLENDVKEYLSQKGYMTTEATYHSVMEQDVVQRLQRIFSLTALYIRGRADRIAIHRYRDIVFEWEAKTHSNIRYTDITIELLPLLHHVAKSKLGVRCLYVCRDNFLNRDVGFFAHELPEIREVHFVSNKLNSQITNFLKRITTEYVGNIPTRNINSNFGSGDPYIIIDNSVANTLQHWKKLIDSIH